MAAFRWTSAGVRTFTVTASNAGGQASAVHQVAIQALPPISSTVGQDGGQLVYTDTQGLTTVLDFPPGAVTETMMFVHTPLPAPGQVLPAGLSFGGHAFTLEAYRGAVLQPGWIFQAPVTLTIRYSAADVAGLDPYALQVLYWNGAAWQDAACGPYERHPAEGWLSVPICHLSEFAMAGSSQARFYLPVVLKQ